MKIDQSIRMLAAFLPLFVGLAAHGADGYGGAWPQSMPRGNAGYANSIADASGHYISDDSGMYLTDELMVEAPPTPGGFSGYLNDRPGSAKGGKACTTGACGWAGSGDPFGPGAFGEPRLWGSVDYMMTWTKGRHLPPLVVGSDTKAGGRLGETGTEILFGGERVGEDIRAGARFSLGMWLDPCENIGIGGRFFLAENDRVSFPHPDPSQWDVVSRPFFDTATELQDTLFMSAPAELRPIRQIPLNLQQVQAYSANELNNLDAYFRIGLYQCGERRLDLLTGYQYSEIRDDLSIRHWSYDTWDDEYFEDRFVAENTFHGATLGLLGEYEYGPVTLQLMSKIGFGNMRQRVRISGRFAEDQDPPEGGLLALDSNMGTHSDAVFAVVPEAEIKLRYQVTRHLDIALGYSMLYWTNVALAADQIETGPLGAPLVNSTQLWSGALAGPADPAMPRIRDTGFWAQGMTFGVTFQH